LLLCLNYIIFKRKSKYNPYMLAEVKDNAAE